MNGSQRLFAKHVQESGFGNFVWTIALAAFTAYLSSPLLLALVIVSLLFALFTYKGVKALRDRLRPPEIGPQDPALNVPRKAVIFTIGPNSAQPDSVVHQVANSLKPQFFGFLGTPQTEEAKTVQALCGSLAIDPDRFKSEWFEPTAIREGSVKTGIVIEWLLDQGLRESDIVVDLTGGKATMTVAAFIAAQERRIDSQYIDSQYENNRAQPGTQKPILITRYTDAESVRSYS